MGAQEVIDRHREAGRFFDVDGVRSFVREEGNGEPVVCIHGVPSSSFLYRKVINALSDRGYRGISFDFPGMGLADRPDDFDYTWSGLGSFCVKALESLDIGPFHLLVHDIGGPVGFEIVSEMSEAIRSLTILNTILRVNEFHRPWVMGPFAYPLMDRIWLNSLIQPVFRPIFYYFCVEDNGVVESDEIDAYLRLLKREDGGRAFLKIMKGFERTSEKQKHYRKVLCEANCPKQAIWGERDPALPPTPYLDHFKEDVGLDSWNTVSARHFLQEEHPELIAKEIQNLSA